MAVEEDFYTVLRTVADRVYPIIMPQNTTLDAITYQVIDSVPENSLDGYAGLKNSRIQVDVWSATYAGSKALAKRVHNVINESDVITAIMISENELYETETQDYRVSMDFSVWHQHQIAV
jgi:hypothetical protein